MRKRLCEIVNMIMIENGNEVLALDKVGSFPGITFPGGHVENNESFLDSVIREAKEETGLDIKNVRLKGIINWCKKESGERYIELLYISNDYSGELKYQTEEGRVFWINKEELKKSKKLSENFNIYMEIYFSDKYQEVFLDWNGNDWNGQPRYQ